MKKTQSMSVFLYNKLHILKGENKTKPIKKVMKMPKRKILSVF